MSKVEDYISYLRERRENILKGGINCIPTPFPKYSEYYYGIEKGKYIGVTAPTKAGKSQLTSYLFIYTPIMFAYENRDKIDLHIHYFSLEETANDIIGRFCSYLLYIKHGIRINKIDLASTKQGNVVNEKILEILENDEEIKDTLKFFEDHITIIDDPNLCNPTGIWKICTEYCRNEGQEIYESFTIKNEIGELEERQRLYKYIPNNPNKYNLVILDHMGLLPEEKGKDKRQTILKMSEYFTKYLRNIYQMTPIAVIQQTFDEELERSAADSKKKPEPTISGLADAKGIARDLNILIGLFAPNKLGIPRYMDYDIRKLQDNVRFMKVLLNREGNSSATYPLYFDGCCCYFDNLPANTDTVGLEELYQNLIKIRNEKIFSDV